MYSTLQSRSKATLLVQIDYFDAVNIFVHMWQHESNQGHQTIK